MAPVALRQATPALKRKAPTKPAQAVPFETLADLVTPEEAMAFLRVGRGTIYELLKSGAIHHLKFGRLIRIPKQALLEGTKT